MIHVGHSSIPVVTGSGLFRLGQVAVTVVISAVLYKWITQPEEITFFHNQ